MKLALREAPEELLAFGRIERAVKHMQRCVRELPRESEDYWGTLQAMRTAAQNLYDDVLLLIGLADKVFPEVEEPIVVPAPIPPPEGVKPFDHFHTSIVSAVTIAGENGISASELFDDMKKLYPETTRKVVVAGAYKLATECAIELDPRTKKWILYRPGVGEGGDC